MTERTAQYTPRPPTENELNELTDWLRDQGYDEPDSRARTAYITVFDQYAQVCPGYKGKVMNVVWGGSPSLFNVYTWSHGKIVNEIRQGYRAIEDEVQLASRLSQPFR